jgi:hypothetical protein
LLYSAFTAEPVKLPRGLTHGTLAPSNRQANATPSKVSLGASVCFRLKGLIIGGNAAPQPANFLLFSTTKTNQFRI